MIKRFPDRISYDTFSYKETETVRVIGPFLFLRKA